jgi:hypothetical protein
MDLDRDAQRLLDLAIEARAPAAEDKARLERKLATMLGAGALAMTPAMAAEAAQHASVAAAGAKAASGTALKWWIASAIIASAVTGYFAVSRTPSQPSSASVHAPAQPVPEPDAPMPDAPLAPEPTLEATEAPAPSLPARAAPTKKRASPSDLNEELELLHRAQSAWRAHDARAALALLDDHRARFPRSGLKLERDGLRVLTLCELGRKAEATTLAQKLLERAPRSPLRGAIEESCALK